MDGRTDARADREKQIDMIAYAFGSVCLCACCLGVCEICACLLASVAWLLKVTIDQMPSWLPAYVLACHA